MFRELGHRRPPPRCRPPPTRPPRPQLDVGDNALMDAPSTAASSSQDTAASSLSASRATVGVKRGRPDPAQPEAVEAEACTICLSTLVDGQSYRLPLRTDERASPSLASSSSRSGVFPRAPSERPLRNLILRALFRWQQENPPRSLLLGALAYPSLFHLKFPFTRRVVRLCLCAVPSTGVE